MCVKIYYHSSHYTQRTENTKYHSLLSLRALLVIAGHDSAEAISGSHEIAAFRSQ